MLVSDESAVVAYLEQCLINRDPEIMSGTPVFMATRVPVKTLLDYMEDGYPLEEFLDSFPSVRRAQAMALLELTKCILTPEVLPSVR